MDEVATVMVAGEPMIWQRRQGWGRWSNGGINDSDNGHSNDGSAMWRRHCQWQQQLGWQQWQQWQWRPCWWRW